MKPETPPITFPETPGLKRIDLQTGRFTANGKNYQIEAQLSVERYAEFQILQRELAFGMSLSKLFEKLTTMYQLMNQNRLVDSSVILNEVLQSMAKLEHKEPVVMKICALFINEEEEDRKRFTEDMLTRKVEDWKQEGIVMDDFFQLASALVPGYLKIFSILTRAISEDGSALAALDQ